uniref:EGF-like domain-containing protein n=1 Tax=Knipowitschia caucasica TaxID=637954 RepID=A0AAV2LT84_KNICA
MSPNRLRALVSDVDECALRLHSCAGATVCENAPGGFHCVCPKGSDCSTSCPHPGGDRLHGEEWTSEEEPCQVCSCQDGNICCTVDLQCVQENRDQPNQF